jgi:hypothetical protein
LDARASLEDPFKQRLLAMFGGKWRTPHAHDKKASIASKHIRGSSASGRTSARVLQGPALVQESRRADSNRLPLLQLRVNCSYWTILCFTLLDNRCYQLERRSVRRCNERLLIGHPHLADNSKAPVQELVRDLVRQPQLILGTPEHVHEGFAVLGVVPSVQAK